MARTDPLQERFVAHAKPGGSQKETSGTPDFRNNHNMIPIHTEKNIPKVTSTLMNRDILYTSLLIRIASHRKMIDPETPHQRKMSTPPPTIRHPLRILVLTTSPSTPLPPGLEGIVPHLSKPMAHFQCLKHLPLTRRGPCPQDPSCRSQHPTTAPSSPYGTTPFPPRPHGRTNGWLPKQRR